MAARQLPVSRPIKRLSGRCFVASARSVLPGGLVGQSRRVIAPGVALGSRSLSWSACGAASGCGGCVAFLRRKEDLKPYNNCRVKRKMVIFFRKKRWSGRCCERASQRGIAEGAAEGSRKAPRRMSRETSRKASWRDVAGNPAKGVTESILEGALRGCHRRCHGRHRADCRRRRCKRHCGGGAWKTACSRSARWRGCFT